MTNNTSLTIISTAIRQDQHGRFSLGDCWAASGKVKAQQPSEWFAAQKTKAFLSVLDGDRESPVTSVSSVMTGANADRGYWAVREAVIHYATWISPEFYLMVIRAFDAMMQVNSTVETTPALPKTYAQALLAAAHAEQERERLAEENEILTPKAQALDKLATLEGVHNLRSAAQQCGWPEKIFISRLMELKWLYSHTVSGRKLAYADKVKSGLIEVKNVEVKRTGYVEGVGQPMITQKGLSQLRILLGTYIAPSKSAPVPFSRPKEAVS